MKSESVGQYEEPARELRRLAREPYERDRRLIELRTQVGERRAAFARKALENLSETNPAMAALLRGEKTADAETHKNARDHHARLAAEAIQRAAESRRRFHATRQRYLATFGGRLAASEGKTQLKFRSPIFWDSDIDVPSCIEGETSIWHGSVFGDWSGAADIVRPPDDSGFWLHPLLKRDNLNCVLSEWGSTFQHITYQMDPPAANFAVDRVRVDLIANGVADSRLGSSWGWYPATNYPHPLFEHTAMTLDVYLAQEVSGAWQYWPLVTNRIFAKNGDYVGQVRIVLSGGAYTAAFAVRSAASGGGPLICLLQVTCAVSATGEHAHTYLDFGAASGLGIFVGGVALLGSTI